jgi:SAM-dependent methyltransferase
MPIVDGPERDQPMATTRCPLESERTAGVPPMLARDLKNALQSRLMWWTRRGSAILFDRLRAVDTLPGVSAGDPVSADIGKPYAYDPAPWRVLSRSLRLASLHAGDFIFVDMGCGKGRVLLSALALPFTRVIGVELSPVLCRIARQNIHNVRLIPRRCAAVEIINADAREYRVPDEPIILFFYNPFPIELMEIVLDNIVKSYFDKVRPIYFIFYACSSIMPRITEFLPRRTDGRARRCISTTIGERSVNIFELPVTTA